MPLPLSVLFVSAGSYCRSPAALAIARQCASQLRVAPIDFDSAGTTSHHRGDLPHPLSSAEGRRRGYVVDHVSRLIHPDDFIGFDLIVCMDSMNLGDLRQLGGAIDQRRGFYRTLEPQQLQLVRRWDPYAMPGDEDLKDPWGGGPVAYSTMYDVLERSIPAMVEHLASLLTESA